MNVRQGNTQSAPFTLMSDTDVVGVAMNEYTALRSEILKRIELMHQVASLGFLVPGTIFAFGFQTKDATILLLYPLLALVLCLLWSQHERRARDCGYYIYTHIETKFEKAMNWEHFMDSTRTLDRFFDQDANWAAIGIFSGTGILAIVVGIPVAIQFGTIIPFWLLLSTAFLAIALITVRLLSPYHHRKRIQHFFHTPHKSEQESQKSSVQSMTGKEAQAVKQTISEMGE